MFGVLILLSMYVSAGLKIFGNWLVSKFPDLDAIHFLEMGLSFLTLSILFALIFKVLPDVRIKARYAFAGGVLSSFLFMIGEWGFAHALSLSAPQSAFGAAGSVVLLMIWVTYGCMILQLGVAFIKALVNHHEGEVRTTRFVMKK
ncbi:MAG: hypothetical protein COA45_02165 [Zetaproteobacteria bacterium]|nr:MAG: hypothetical protein COA45_02165 [Zetaproteobacteria bacterium]